MLYCSLTVQKMQSVLLVARNRIKTKRIMLFGMAERYDDDECY
jgi:hypothetical protein